MTIATGKVLARKYEHAARAKSTGTLWCIRFSAPWYTRYEAPTALAIMPNTLKMILTGSLAVFVLHRHWTRPAVQAISSVSGRDISKMPSRTKRKLTDIVPSMPGKRTFSLDARAAMVK